MKKKLLFVLILLSTLFITGCTTKETLEPNQFKTQIEKKGFIVVDQTSAVIHLNADLTYSYIATTPDQRYAVEYYSFNGESGAQAFYAQKHADVTATGGQVSSELNQGNYQKYTLNHNGKYTVISRISNTVVFVHADKNYMEEINIVVKDIGY